MCRRVAAAVALMLVQASPAKSQILYGPGFGGGFATRSQFKFSVVGPGFHYSARARGFYAAPVFPYYCGIIPPYGPGWGPGYGNPFFLPPPGGFALPEGFDPGVVPAANTIPVNPNPAPPRPPKELPLAARKDEFIVISPKGQFPPPAGKGAVTEGTMTPKVDRVAPPPERPRPTAIGFDPFAQRQALGKTDVPEPDLVAESARQIGQARQAFALEEYGAAAEHLDRAIRARPDDPLPHFLKAQAQFAAGQYADAVASIRDGLKLSANWPASGFKPKDLYAGKTERFDAHLAALQKTLAANPNQPALQFLLAYQLWFAGERAEATRLFRNLATRVKDPAIVERFLKEMEGK